MNLPISARPGLSFTYLLRGLKLLLSPELRSFVLAPVLANLVVYGAAFYAGVRYFSMFMQWLLALLPAWLGFLNWILWPIFALALVLVVYFTFTLLVNLIGAPFHGRLAEKTWTLARGPGTLPKLSLCKEIVGGTATELRRLGYFVARAVPLLILFVIPGLNLVAPFLWMVFNAWFLALEYLAYPMELQGVGFAQQREAAKGMRAGVLSFGGAAMVGLAMPGLNILIPPAAVIGATLYLAEADSARK